MNIWWEIVISVFLLGGALFALVGSIGLARLPDFFTRVHAPTTGTTLGVGGTLIGSVIYFNVTGGWLTLHELLISMFLFITAPVSGHMMAKAAMHLRVKTVPGTRGKPWVTTPVKRASRE